MHCASQHLPDLLQGHFKRILPEAQVEAINAMYTEAEEERLLCGNPDFVLDAIDNIDTKVALLAACHRRGIQVLSSAGAGRSQNHLHDQPTATATVIVLVAVLVL